MVLLRIRSMPNSFGKILQIQGSLLQLELPHWLSLLDVACEVPSGIPLHTLGGLCHVCNSCLLEAVSFAFAVVGGRSEGYSIIGSGVRVVSEDDGEGRSSAREAPTISFRQETA